MGVFEIVITLLVAGVVFSAVARRLHIPYPALLALAGAVLALLPNLPIVSLDPQLALTLFVAPVLLDAAFDASPRDLKQNWRSVTSLAVGAVIVTVAAVALVARWALPGLSWPSAIALGAVVAPPDAAAATAVLKQLRPPHRMLVVLEGESLFNDASALLIYRLAVMAAVDASFSGWRVAPMLILVVAGSVLLGAVLARASTMLARLVDDVSTAILTQFLTTFLVWMLAEGLHLSGIITMVTFAILVARRTPARTPARLRVPSYAVWDLAVFVLNVLAFILVGLQLKPIVQNLDHAQLLTYAITSAAVCATVIVVRMAWVIGHVTIAISVRNWIGYRMKQPPLVATLRTATAIGWCGMRGIVTLATALALPPGFAHRDFVLFAAFAVVLGTLVVQGATLSPLMRLLGLKDDGSIDQEVRRARADTARAALESIVDPGAHDMVQLLHHKYRARLHRAERAHDPSTSSADADPINDGAGDYLEALRRAQSAERQTLVDLRANGTIGDDAFHRVEEELDLAELNTDAMARQD